MAGRLTRMRMGRAAVALALAAAALAAPAEGLYCIVDLSGGVKTNQFAVTYSDAVPAGGWTDLHRTDRLVLRRVTPPGTQEAEDGQATPAAPYYLGVFEVTQRQRELVMGARPSYFNSDSCYGVRPVEKVSYDMIRGNVSGAAWPARTEVDEGSFMHVLRQKTSLKFDLPTEAQWAYACRAGGADVTNVSAVARHALNSGYAEGSYAASSDSAKGTARVGSYAPNGWGFYDMLGNVVEWCLDCDAAHMIAPGDVEENPAGRLRVLRGGAWDCEATELLSSDRVLYRASYRFNITGFRVCLSADAVTPRLSRRITP